jgi:prepilin-type N-terminal cleavage/methylation domain-containing protein
MKYRLNRGFTLIELLVVISIISLLSSIVFAALNSARVKGKDAAIKQQLNAARAQILIAYDADPTNRWTVVCAAVQVKFLTPVSAVCQQNLVTGYELSAPLNVQNQVNGTSGIDYWCLDTTGISKVVDDDPSADPAIGC